MGGGESIVAIIGTISVFGVIGLLIYLYFRTRHKERMALIESGQDASMLKGEKDISGALKWGIFILAIGIALFLGHFLEANTTMDEGAGYFPLIFTFAGIALLIYYNIAKKERIEDDQV
jgi:Na+/melibiose symporter-like transporter